MDQMQAIWIKDPLGIFADSAERGVVVRNGRIVELVPAGGRPATTGAAAFDASQHVVLPGLINTHHHFYQTLTRGAAGGDGPRIVSPGCRRFTRYGPRLTPESLELGVTVAMSELLLSGCTTTTDHHYVFPAGLEDAVDIEVAVAKRLGVRVAADARFDEPFAAQTAVCRRIASCRTRTLSWPTARAVVAQISPARRGRHGADCARALFAVFR